MNWFKNLKIAPKLLVMTAFMLVVMAIIGWQGLMTSQKMNSSLGEIYNVNLIGIYRLEEAQANYLRLRANTLNYILRTDVGTIEQNMRELAKSMKDQVAEYKKVVVLEEDMKMANNLERLLGEYEKFVFEIVQLVKNGKRQLAAETVETDGTHLNEDIRKQLDELVAFNENDAKDAKNTANKDYQGAFQLMLVVGTLGILISLFLGIFVAGLISKPLGLAVETLKIMAKGDFTSELVIDTKDEIGAMGKELNTMKDGLSELVANIIDTSSRVGNGSHEIAVGNQDLSQRTQEQASTLEEVASTIEEINSSIQQTAASTEQADQISQTTLAAVKEGEKAVGETMDAMKEISVSSQQIADIIKVVNDIAFQTNLLALNAAVEAARAGEQGRGFAVVAAEVRNLAGRTAESSKEIEKLIKESVDRVENGNVMVQKASEMLKQIVQNTKHTSDVVVEIGAAVKEQAGATGQIQSAIEQLNQVTQQNASMVEEIASSSESLNAEAEGLGEMVSVFKIKGQTQGGLQRATKSPGKKDLKPGAGLRKDKSQLAPNFKEDDLEQF